MDQLKIIIRKLIDYNKKIRAEREFYKNNSLSVELIESVKALNEEIIELLEED